jgi:hypothetical protein
MNAQELHELIVFLEDISHDDGEVLWRRRRAVELAMLLMQRRSKLLSE